MHRPSVVPWHANSASSHGSCSEKAFSSSTTPTVTSWLAVLSPMLWPLPPESIGCTIPHE